MVLSGLRFGLCAVLLSAVLLRAVLQVEVDTDCILVSTGVQQVRRQGTAQQCPMRRLTQVRGAGNLGGIAFGGAVLRRVLQTVELHRVGQSRRGGRNQRHRARCAARMLTANYSTVDYFIADHSALG